MNDVVKHLSTPLFRRISRTVDAMGVRAFVVGGYVRDYYLRRPCTDIDVVVVGSGIAVAEALGRELHAKVSVFKTFGTAMLRIDGMEVEFVGARRESYSPDSRKPHVEDGTIENDQRRRDFTINAMAWSLNADTFGELVDPFEGMYDLEDCLIRTPCDPDITFSDDPLRMMRGVRFASQLGFEIDDETFEAIRRNCNRIRIVSKERIAVELNKIVMSPRPSLGFELLDMTGLLELIFPEMSRLKGIDRRNGHAHKDIFKHTLKVLDNVARRSDDLWLRWAAVLHDIAKPATKAYDARTGWTFHSHEVLGSKMVPSIFRSLKLPMNEHMKFVQKMVFLHLRPIILSEEMVTDSAVRRLLFEAGDDVEALMTLCESDITSGIDAKVKRYMANFELVRRKMKDLEERDRIRNFQPPITGDIIMRTYGIPPCSAIGEIKEEIKNAILDGAIRNDYDEAYAMMERLAAERGFVKFDNMEHYGTGYALSGGFIKGFAHLGAMQALQEYGVCPEIISAVSAGSIVGAFYADGNEPYRILDFFDKLSFTDLTSFSIREHGLFKLDALVDFLRSRLHARRIEELKLPMIITATDLDRGISAHFRKGDLAECIAASCCLPILFAPRRIDDTYYVDGGLLMNLPVTTLRPICRRVVAVNVSTLPTERGEMGLLDIALRSYNLMFQANSILQKQQCDFLIEPQGLDAYGNGELEKAEEIFGRGYDAAVEAIEKGGGLGRLRG